MARRTSSFDVKATLQEIKELFDFIVTEDQTRFADVWKMQSLSEYGAVMGQACEEPETVSLMAAIEPREESAIMSLAEEKPSQDSKQTT